MEYEMENNTERDRLCNDFMKTTIMCVRNMD